MKQTGETRTGTTHGDVPTALTGFLHDGNLHLKARQEPGVHRTIGFDEVRDDLGGAPYPSNEQIKAELARRILTP